VLPKLDFVVHGWASLTAQTHRQTIGAEMAFTSWEENVSPPTGLQGSKLAPLPKSPCAHGD
jgi:hypothetical protein